MERAISLMRRAKRVNLSEIACECGYNSLSSFSRSFKKRYGSSPTLSDMDQLLKLSKIGQTYPIPSRYYLNPFPDDEREMEFPVQIVDKDDLNLAYIRCYGLYLDGQKGMDAYARLMAWAAQNGHRVPGAQVIGMSPDDPEVTPLAKCRYDLCITLNCPIKPEGEIGFVRLPAAQYAVHHCRGDITAFEQAWNYFFKVWFPNSGYVPAHRPAMEIFLSLPEEVGWEYFDIECCVPIRPLWSGDTGGRGVRSTHRVCPPCAGPGGSTMTPRPGISVGSTPRHCAPDEHSVRRKRTHRRRPSRHDGDRRQPFDAVRSTALPPRFRKEWHPSAPAHIRIAVLHHPRDRSRSSALEPAWPRRL